MVKAIYPQLTTGDRQEGRKGKREGRERRGGKEREREGRQRERKETKEEEMVKPTY